MIWKNVYCERCYANKFDLIDYKCSYAFHLFSLTISELRSDWNSPSLSQCHSHHWKWEEQKPIDWRMLEGTVCWRLSSTLGLKRAEQQLIQTFTHIFLNALVCGAWKHNDQFWLTTAWGWKTTPCYWQWKSVSLQHSSIQIILTDKATAMFRFQGIVWLSTVATAVNDRLHYQSQWTLEYWLPSTHFWLLFILGQTVIFVCFL